MMLNGKSTRQTQQVGDDSEVTCDENKFRIFSVIT